MELQFDLDFPHGEDDIKIATPMELQLTWSVHTDKMISKLPPLWNFNLTWSVTYKVISTSPAPLQLQSDLDCPQG